MRCVLGVILTGLVGLIGGEASAEVDSAGAIARPDAIIVIGEESDALGSRAETRHQLDPRDQFVLRAQNTAQLVRRLPSAHTPTNSRGETLLYLRSAGERQIATLFDGALLNIPWDNRFDLKLFPRAAVGGLSTASGPLSPQYGVNALGVANISPPSIEPEGVSATLEASGGTGGLKSANAALSVHAPSLSIFAAGGAMEKEGDPLSSRVATPFHQRPGDLRTNTDEERLHALLRIARETDRGGLSATFLIHDQALGVAPESDRADGSRFWRYPDRRLTMGVVSGTRSIGTDTELRGAVWAQTFRQTIDSFTDSNYETVADRQNEKDRTIGARGIIRRSQSRVNLVGSASILNSEHRQSEFAFESGAPPAFLPDTLVFGQTASSLGVDIEFAASPDMQLEIGAGGDFVSYGRTGDKPRVDSLARPVLRAALVWSPDSPYRLRAALGRKSRMPTPRELFGTAINRFLLNPSLRPETLDTAELGLGYETESVRIETVVFAQNVRDTIDQRQVGTLRQRINLPGSDVFGIELAGAVELTPTWRASGAVTATRGRRDSTGPGQSDRLLERPSLLARLALDYAHPSGFLAGGEVVHRGRAFSLNGEGATEALKISTEISFHASYRVASLPSRPELYLRLNNATDAAVEPQIGLPAPGRMFIGGVKASF